MNDGGTPEHALVVVRCKRCGDTFPSDEQTPICPTCGGCDVQPAQEPLL